MIRLTSVDLPTLGRPTTATTGCGPARRPRRSTSGSPQLALRIRRRVMPTLTVAVEQLTQLRDDLVDAQLGGVQHDGVGGLAQRVGRAGRVEPVPPGQVGGGRAPRRRRPRRCGAGRGPPRRRSGRPSGRRRGRRPSRCRGPRPRSAPAPAMISRCRATSSARTAGHGGHGGDRAGDLGAADLRVDVRRRRRSRADAAGRCRCVRLDLAGDLARPRRRRSGRRRRAAPPR